MTWPEFRAACATKGVSQGASYTMFRQLIVAGRAALAIEEANAEARAIAEAASNQQP